MKRTTKLNDNSLRPIAGLVRWAAALTMLVGVLPMHGRAGMAGAPANGSAFVNDGARLMPNPTGALGAPSVVSTTIYSLVADIPAGKIYVGGDMRGVSDASTSIQRENLARLNSDGTVDASFVVTTADQVRAMVMVGNDLYVGGDFSDGGSEDSRDSAGAFRSDNVLRLDRSTGLIDRSWVPSGLTNVYSMVYVTGTSNYMLVGMSGSGYLKALSMTNGSTFATIPDFDDVVRALVWDGNYLYVGGEEFGTNGKPDYLRRYTFNGTTFTYDSAWQPVASNPGMFDDWVRAMVIHDGYLYVAGAFDNPGAGGNQEALVRIPLTSTTGVIDPAWIPGIESNIYALAVSGNLLYTGGNDTDYHGALRYVLGAGTPVRDVHFNPAHSFAQTTGIPATLAAHDYEDIYAILPLTTTVLYGGDFATLNGVARPGGLAMVTSAASTVPDAPTMNAPTGSGRGPYTFSGTAQPGVRVTLYDGEAVVSSTVVAAGGAWSFTTGGNLAVGEHVFVARAQPIYEIGLPTLLPTADSAPYTVTVGGTSSAVGATYVVTFTGVGKDGSLKIQQAGGGDLINVYDPVALSPKDSTNSRSLSAPGAAPVNTAQLIVMGYDIDWPTGEWDYVYLNGRELGRLTGASNTWNATIFDIPDLSWVNNGVNTLQFKVTAYGETHYDHWTANIAGATLLIDGGAGDRASLLSLEAPLPVSGVTTPTAVFTTAAETQFRVEYQLLDANGDVVASNRSADVGLTIDERYTVTLPITYTAASYAGYSVRAVLYANVDTVWVPQGSLQTYFDVAVTAGRSGSGSGTVTSTPAGISCGVTCTALFDYASVLTLTAAPSSTSKFTGWSGDCSGTSTTCVVTMTTQRVATATFELKSTDAHLRALTTSVGTLTPAFVSTTTSYTLDIDYGSTNITVFATPEDVNATYVISSNNGLCASGICDVTPGAVTTVTVEVTVQDGVTKKTYWILVHTAGPNADATLSDLAIDPGTLAPTFVSGTRLYTGSVPDGTSVVIVTATAPSRNAQVSYASSAGECKTQGDGLDRRQTEGGGPMQVCAVSTTQTTWITVTVTAQDGTAQAYVIKIPRTTPLTTIGRVWPTLGVPEGGMPVTLLGTGFAAATGVRVSNTITNVLVTPFTVTGDGRIDFVMPAGVDGTFADITVETANGSTSVAQAFLYQAPVHVEFDGQTGTVISLSSGVVITVPPQGVDGMFVITLTPQPPQSDVPGNLLLHVFRLDAMLDWNIVDVLTNPVTIAVPVPDGVVPAGQTPWLYQYQRTSDVGRSIADGSGESEGDRPSAAGGRWTLVPGQTYDVAGREVRVALRPTGLYALSALQMRVYYLPTAPVQR